MSSYEKVWPKTLVIKSETETSPSHVFGGQQNDVWVASFADRSEAEAWVMASNHFGEEIIGVKDSAYGTTRADGGEVSEGPDTGSGRGVREVQTGDEGRAGSTGEFPEGLPLPGRDEVGHWG
jgi:hypothetical protein